MSEDQFNSEQWDLDPRKFETPEQTLVREGYEELTLGNREVLQDFDPDKSDIVYLPLATDPEYEAAEPQLAAVNRQNMLRELGLTFHPLEEGDPDKIYEYTYPTGEADQIRYITRQDGSRTPVFLGIGKDQKGNQVVEEAVLIPSAQLEAAIRHREDDRDTYLLDTRLTEEFELDKEMLKTANLSLDDKRTMLASFDKIQQLDIATPDVAALAKMRRKLAKAMLPGNKLFEKGDALDSLKTAYEQQVGATIKQYGLDDQTSLEFAQSERLYRLQALNEQLHSRQRAKKLGLVALTGLTTAVTTLFGAGTEAITRALHGDENVQPPITGAIAGAALGLAVGLEKAGRMHKQRRRIEGFKDREYYSKSRSIVSSQLDQEALVALKYNTILNN
jgi:hypothetical protein